MDEEIITKTYLESGTKFRDEHHFEIECAYANRYLLEKRRCTLPLITEPGECQYFFLALLHVSGRCCVFAFSKCEFQSSRY